MPDEITTMQGAAEAAQTEQPGTEGEISTDAGETTIEGQVATGEGQETTQPETEPQTTPNDQTATFDPLAELDKIQNLDPKLKDELKKGYLRQSDYTKKTQEVAGDRKLLEEYKGMKPYIDRVLQDEALSKLVFEGQQAQGEEGQDNQYPDDVNEFAARIKQEAVAETINAIRIQAAIDNDYNSAAALDTRLNSDPEFAKIIGGYVAQDKDFIAGRKTAVQATQEALAAHEQYLAKMKSSFKSDLDQQVKKKTLVMPQGTSSPGEVSSGAGATSMREAAAKAEEDLATGN